MRVVAVIVAIAIATRSASGMSFRVGFPDFNEILRAPSTGGVRVVFATDSQPVHGADFLMQVQRMDEIMQSLFNAMDEASDPPADLHSNLRGTHQHRHVCLHRCKSDIEQFCPHANQAPDALAECLIQNKQKVSLQCLPVVNKLVEVSKWNRFENINDESTSPVLQHNHGMSPAFSVANGVFTHPRSEPWSAGGKPVADTINAPPADAAEPEDEDQTVAKAIAASVVYNHRFMLSVLVQVLVIMALMQVVRALIVRVRSQRALDSEASAAGDLPLYVLKTHYQKL